MISSPSTPSALPPSPVISMIPSLRSRLSAATQGFHDTVSEMLTLLDAQVQELQQLRLSLATIESRLQHVAPASPIGFDPPRTALQPVSLPQAVMPAASAPVAVRAPTQLLPENSGPQLLSASAPVTDLTARLPSGPMMTQILWPSKPPQDTPPIPQAPPSPAPATAAPLIMSPLQSMTRPLMAAPPPIAPPPPVLPQSVLPAQAPELPQPASDQAAAPDLGNATIEELNAALAYAFAQVSTTKPIGGSSLTQMMPPPMPTSALRYGQVPDLAPNGLG